MCLHCVVLLFVHATMALDFVSRAEWNAKPPKQIQLLNVTVPFVIIHHSDSPPVCFTDADCSKAMQGMQKYHQQNQQWDDIGYK